MRSGDRRPSRFALPLPASPPHGQACLCCHALARNCHKADLPRWSENCAVCSLAATARAQVAHRHADQAPGTAFLHDGLMSCTLNE